MLVTHPSTPLGVDADNDSEPPRPRLPCERPEPAELQTSAVEQVLEFADHHTRLVSFWRARYRRSLLVPMSTRAFASSCFNAQISVLLAVWRLNGSSKANGRMRHIMMIFRRE